MTWKKKKKKKQSTPTSFVMAKALVHFYSLVRHFKSSSVMQGNNLTVYQCKPEYFYMMVQIFGIRANICGHAV